MKMSHFRFSILSAAIICVSAIIIGCGCEMFANHTDPMADSKAGWKNFYPNPEPDATITKDYQDYMHHLPSNVGPMIDARDFFFEDGKGRHAVKIKVPSNGTEWTHVLIYDQNDKRIRIIKYISGHYAS